MTRKIVVAGASGFVGRHLIPLLQAAGHEVVCGTRNPVQARQSQPDRTWVHLDVNDTDSLDLALQGAESLIYLVHQMQDGTGDLLEIERRSALNVRQAAEKAGLRRLVYLGGPNPEGLISHHLEARLETGRVLRAGSISTIELQAGMIIGVGSESWLIVRDLALRLPVMILPSWLSRRSQPVGIEDVIRAITACLDLESSTSRCLALTGPETLTAREILERVASQVGIRPVMIPLPVLTPSLSSHWIRWITRADYTIARQLVDGLTCDLLGGEDSVWNCIPTLHITPLDQVIADALQAESPTDMSAFQRYWEAFVRRLALRAKR